MRTSLPPPNMMYRLIAISAAAAMLTRFFRSTGGYSPVCAESAPLLPHTRARAHTLRQCVDERAFASLAQPSVANAREERVLGLLSRRARGQSVPLDTRAVGGSLQSRPGSHRFRRQSHQRAHCSVSPVTLAVPSPMSAQSDAMPTMIHLPSGPPPTSRLDLPPACHLQ